MATTIANCTCVSPYQDQKHGKGRRVFNKGSAKIRCTVCTKELKGDGVGDPVKPKK
jgi:hypothetical protein